MTGHQDPAGGQVPDIQKNPKNFDKDMQYIQERSVDVIQSYYGTTE